VPDEPDYELPKLLGQLADRMDTLQSEAEAGLYTEQAFLDEYSRRIVEPLQAHLKETAKRRNSRQADKESGRQGDR
jgi:hypothetical protein